MKTSSKAKNDLSIPAELELIGSLIGRPEKLNEVDFLTREDFIERRHFDIYQAIQRLHATGEEVSILTLGVELGFTGDEYGYLALLAKDYGIYSDNFRYRAVLIRKYATDRACHTAAKTGDWARIVQLRQEYEKLAHLPPKTMTARELLAMEFPPLRWWVEGVLPEGVTLLVSPPKVGKTRLATQLAIAVASGGYALNHPDTPCRPTEVLYLILESGNRRAQKDLKQIGGDAPQVVDRLHVAADWRRLSEGGAADLARWLDAHPAVKLVIIDTLAAVRNAGHGGSGFLYSEDYLVGSTIKRIADQRGVSVVLIHHSRKADAEDVLDTVSGSTGVTGSVDHILVIKRQRLEQDGTLTLISRDFEDRELALRYQSGLWTLLGQADEVARHDPDWKGDGQSDARREILALLRQEPMTPAELAEALGKNRSSVRYLLMKLAEDGKVIKQRDDGYIAAVGVDPVGAVGAVGAINNQLESSEKLHLVQSDQFENQHFGCHSDKPKITPNTPNTPNRPNTPNTPNSGHDRAALVGLLVDGYKGRGKAELMQATGWPKERFEAAKDDLMVRGIIELRKGGWYVVEGKPS